MQNPYPSGTQQTAPGQLGGVGGVRADVLAGGGGGVRPMSTMPGTQHQASLVRFRDPNQHAIIPGQMFAQGGAGAGGAGAMPGGMPGSGAGGGAYGTSSGFTSGFMNDPSESYRQAAEALGIGDNQQINAVMNYGPGGAAAVHDQLAIQREQEQRANRDQALENVRGDRERYMSSVPRQGHMGMLEELFANPDVLGEDLQRTILSQQNSAISGGANAARDRLRDATGGMGGAFVAGQRDIGRDETLRNLDALHRMRVDSARENRMARHNIMGDARSFSANDEGIIGRMREEERDTLAADIRLPEMSGAISVAGLQQALQGGGGPGGFGGQSGFGAAGSAAFGHVPAWSDAADGQQVMRHRNRNFGGIGLDTSGMNHGSASGGGNSSIRVRDGRREMVDPNTGRWIPAQDAGPMGTQPGSAPLGQWRPDYQQAQQDLGATNEYGIVASSQVPGQGVGGTSPFMAGGGSSASPLPGGMTPEQMQAFLQWLQQQQGR